jgi:hypothetical protein
VQPIADSGDAAPHLADGTISPTEAGTLTIMVAGDDRQRRWPRRRTFAVVLASGMRRERERVDC